jgi:hypothetical protein
MKHKTPAVAGVLVIYFTIPFLTVYFLPLILTLPLKLVWAMPFFT